MSRGFLAPLGLVLLGPSLFAQELPLATGRPHDVTVHGAPRVEALTAWAGGTRAEDVGDLRAVSFAASGEERTLTSDTLVFEPFDECLVSWNARHALRTGFGVEISVARAADGEFSPWMWLGEWNVSLRPAQLVQSFDDARIEVDTFTAKTPWRALRLRVRARTDGSAPLGFELDRLTCMPTLRAARGVFGAPAAAVPRIAAKFRSQRDEDASIASRICSPTSLAMVLEVHGVHAATAEVARRAFDPFHDLYGNWNRAIQTATSFGVTGRLERIASWKRAEELVRGGQPLILSIAAKPGELRGAPYASTSGHLLVLSGFDEHGDALVLDPAASDAKSGEATYARTDLENVWLKRGGTTYVLGNARDGAR